MKQLIPIRFQKEYNCYINNAVINAYFFGKDISLKCCDFKDKITKRKIMQEATSIIAEEILHLIYFEYWNKVFKKKYTYEQVYDLGTDEYSGWLISEIVPEFVLIENPKFRKFGWNKQNRTEAGYFWIPKHKKRLRKMFKENNFRDFLIETHKEFNIK